MRRASGRGVGAVRLTGSLFPAEEFEVPLVRAPRARKGAAAGSWVDARFQNEYPADWDRCSSCDGTGWAVSRGARAFVPFANADGRPRGDCKSCEAMGSWKAMVRLQAGHRCLRCRHPYMPKGDAKMLGGEASGMQPCPQEGCTNGELLRVSGTNVASGTCPTCKGDGKVWTPFSTCDGECDHGGPIRYRFGALDWNYHGRLSESGWKDVPGYVSTRERLHGAIVDAEWRILTVHHLDGDKANCRWWNLVPLCQRCHLEIQAKVVMERVYPHEHSDWFKPFAAGYYAFVYLCATCAKPVPAVRAGLGLDSLRGYVNRGDNDEYPHICKPGLEVGPDQVAEQLEELLALERLV